MHWLNRSAPHAANMAAAIAISTSKLARFMAMPREAPRFAGWRSPDHLHSLDAAHPRMSPNLGLGSCQPKLRKPLR